MSYRFGAETVYANAFYAAKDVCEYLSENDISTFCGMVRDAMPDAREETGEVRCCRVTFDLDETFLSSPRSAFKRVGGLIFHRGTREVSDDELRRSNLCLGSGAAAVAFASARKRFREQLLREQDRGLSRSSIVQTLLSAAAA